MIVSVPMFILAFFVCIGVYMWTDLDEHMREQMRLDELWSDGFEVPALPMDAGECGAAVVSQTSLGLTAGTAAGATVIDWAMHESPRGAYGWTNSPALDTVSK